MGTNTWGSFFARLKAEREEEAARAGAGAGAEEEEEEKKDKFRFLFVRHPFARLVSAYVQVCLKMPQDQFLRSGERCTYLLYVVGAQLALLYRVPTI